MDRRLGLRSASVGAKPRSTGPRAPPIISVNQLKLVGCRPRGCNGLIDDLHRFLLPQAVQIYFYKRLAQMFSPPRGLPGNFCPDKDIFFSGRTAFVESIPAPVEFFDFHFHPSGNSLPNQHSDSRCDKPDGRAKKNRPQDQMFRKAKLHEFVLRLIKRIVFRAVRM